MIYFLHGEDSYRAKRKLEEIVGGYKKVHKSGLNLVYVDVKDKGFAEFYGNFKITSMFAEKKLVVLKNVFSDKKFQEDFLENLDRLEELKDIVIIFESEKADKRVKLFKELEKKCKAQEFEFLQPAQAKKWVAVEFEKNGAKADDQAVDLLLSFVGSDLWRLHNEVIKLSSYKVNKVITVDDVRLLVKPRIENDIFKTVEALASKNKRTAMALLQKHLEAGDNELYLLTMIAYQFKNLLAIKELIEQRLPYPVVSKKSGLHPFVVQKTYPLCGQFSLQDLKNIYRRIFTLDFEIKTGKVDPDLALDLLLSEI